MSAVSAKTNRDRMVCIKYPVLGFFFFFLFLKQAACVRRVWATAPYFSTEQRASLWRLSASCMMDAWCTMRSEPACFQQGWAHSSNIFTFMWMSAERWSDTCLDGPALPAMLLMELMLAPDFTGFYSTYSVVNWDCGGCGVDTVSSKNCCALTHDAFAIHRSMPQFSEKYPSVKDIRHLI